MWVFLSCCVPLHGEPGQRIWYSDLLWAGQSTDHILVEVRFSAPLPDRPSGLPTLWEKKQLGHGLKQLFPSSAEVKKGKMYTTIPHLVLHGMLQGEMSLLHISYFHSSFMDLWRWYKATFPWKYFPAYAGPGFNLPLHFT